MTANDYYQIIDDYVDTNDYEEVGTSDFWYIVKELFGTTDVELSYDDYVNY